MLVTKKNPQGCKKYIVSFLAFDFGEGVTILDWLANMKIYVYDIEE